ncbi:MAG: acyl-CoA dehydrogenase family protein, partial [Planctomycetota bacterium]
MTEENYFLNNTDIQYHFKKTIPWEKLVELVESNYRQKDGFKNLTEAVEFYQDILSNVGKFIPKEVVPRSRAIDRQGNQFVNGEVQNPKELDEIIQKCKELGLHSLIQPREFGGLNVPFTIQCILIEMFCRADISAYTNITYYNAIAQFLFMFSLLEGSTKIQNGTIIQTRFQKAIEDITSGNAWGAMVLTEPNAGSDLGNLQTKAVFNGTHWTMTGRKIFITEGHGEHHIVLARTAAPKAGGLGLDGLSLFYVPRHLSTEQGRIQNFIIEGIEHKIGLHGSPTCSIVYENAYSELIGEQGQGFTQMVRMMNGFRLGVGFQCLGMLQGAFSMALAYAETRVSMGKPIIDHELIADMLFNIELDL